MTDVGTMLGMDDTTDDAGAGRRTPPPPALDRYRRVAWAAGAPLVLVVVLAGHVALRSTSDLTPWKGGGFGMFSTVDSPGTRFLRVELRGETGTFAVRVPDRLESLAGEVRAAPAEDRLRLLGREVAELFWVIPRPGLPKATSPGDAEVRDLFARTLTEFLPPEAVRPIPRQEFDPARQRRVKLTEVSVAVWRIRAETDDRPAGGGTLRPEVLRSVVVPASIGGRR